MHDKLNLSAKMSKNITKSKHSEEKKTQNQNEKVKKK